MADHQTTVTPPAPQTPEPAVVLPRSQDPTPPETGDPAEKAAREAKERMSKTNAFWNRLSPPKEEVESAKPPKPPKPPEPSAPATKKEEPVAAAPEAPTAAEPKEKKGRARKKEPEIDPIELARATGQEIGREMAKVASATNVPRGTIDPEPEPELPAEFQPDIAVFEEMAQLDPKRYGNIKKDLARYTKAEDEYTAQWEKDHPDEPYDADAPEHNAFYARIRPNYDEKDFKQAQESLIEKKVEKKVETRILEKIKSRETENEQRRERAAQIQPELDRDMFSALGDMLIVIDPENAELAKDPKTIDSLKDKNELAYDVLLQVHNETKPIAAATLRLFRYVDKPDASDPAHVRVFDVIAKAEQAIARLPMKERYDDDGRLFATQDDYARMSPADKARHWYVGERETLAIIRGQAIARTKAIYDQENQKIARYSKRNASQPSQAQPSKKAETTPQPKPDNGSPTVGGRGTLPGDGQSAASKPQTGRDMLFGRLLGT